MTGRPRAPLLAALLLVHGPCLAQGAPRDVRPGAAEDTWVVRLTGQMGGGYVSYRERLSRWGTKSDFEEGCFALRLGVEGNLAGFSPHLRLETLLASGEEDAHTPTTRQEADLWLEALLLDLGAGYRLDLGRTVTLVPSLSYTLMDLDFERSEFVVDGDPVLIMDLNGGVHDEIGEEILTHGLSPRLGIELALTDHVELHLHGGATFVLDAEVDNDLGGALHTEGFMVRGGADVNVRLLDRLALRIGCAARYLELDDRGPKLRTGSAGMALIHFPDARALTIDLLVGVEGRF